MGRVSEESEEITSGEVLSTELCLCKHGGRQCAVFGNTAQQGYIRHQLKMSAIGSKVS